MKSLYFILIFIFLSCKNDLCGTYEILDSSKFEKEILQEKLDSLKYLRKNVGNYVLKLYSDSIFKIKDKNGDVINNFEGKWKFKKGKISMNYKQNNYNIEKEFFINKNTLLNIEKVKLCENDKYINNIIFLTKTKNSE